MVGCWKSECTLDDVLPQRGCFDVIRDVDAFLIIRHTGGKSGRSLPITVMPTLFETLQVSGFHGH